MEYRERVEEILKKAEDSRRSLMSSAAAEGKYQEVIKLANVAHALEELQSSDTVTVVGATAPEVGAGGKQLSKSQIKKTYPVFLRARDALVKVGWSKRHRAEYEHRAPRTVLMALVSTLEKRAKHTTRFSSDNIFPLSDPKNDDIPGYQGYVALAWLSFIGAIERQGRQGYRIVAKRTLRDLVEEQWTAIPER